MQTVLEQIFVLVRLAVVLGVPVLILWGIDTFGNPRNAWLYISSFVGLFVWLLFKAIRDALAAGRLRQMLSEWAFVVAGVIVFSVVFLGGWGLVASGIESLRRRIRKRQYRLPEGVTKEMVLRKMPYELTYFQGESDYRVVDKRTGEFIDWQDPQGAEGWIIRQYLKQRRNKQGKGA